MTAFYGSGVGSKKVFQTQLTDTSTTDKEGVGAIREDDLGNKYRWVKNVDTTAFVAKQPVCYDSAANVGASDYLHEVTRAVAAELMNAAGICITAIGASGALMYGWIQIYGLCPDVRVVTPATGANDIEEGSELIAVNAATHLIYQGNAGTASIYSNHFRAAEVLATATGAAVATKDVFVYCI